MTDVIRIVVIATVVLVGDGPGLAGARTDDSRHNELTVSADANAASVVTTTELVDGTVASAWGDFVPARTIRKNCRKIQEVIRSVPHEEDFTTKCDHETVFDHPYASFSDDQLLQIANSDAEAAYLIAHRLLLQPSADKKLGRDPRPGLDFARKALVLSGEKQVFELILAGWHFKNFQVWASANGQPTPDQVQRKANEYFWFKLGRNLGFIEDMDARWTLLLREISRHSQHFDVEELDKRARVATDGFHRAREHVTGEVRE